MNTRPSTARIPAATTASAQAAASTKQFVLTPALVTRIEKEAARLGVAQSEIARRALTNYLKALEASPALP